MKLGDKSMFILSHRNYPLTQRRSYSIMEWFTGKLFGDTFTRIRDWCVGCTETKDRENCWRRKLSMNDRDLTGHFEVVAFFIFWTNRKFEISKTSMIWGCSPITVKDERKVQNCLHEFPSIRLNQKGVLGITAGERLYSVKWRWQYG